MKLERNTKEKYSKQEIIMSNEKTEYTNLSEGLYLLFKGFYSATSNIFGHFSMTTVIHCDEN